MKIIPNYTLRLSFLISLIAVFSFASHSLDEEYISIETLVNAEKISVNCIGIGGHSGSCINMDLRNLTAQAVKIKIEPGRRLASVNPELQDILIVKSMEIDLPAYQDSVVDIYGFCCQSTHSSPERNDLFTIGRMAETDLVSLSHVIDKDSFPSSAIQSAVWAISNNHPVSSVYFSDEEAIKLLRNKVANIRNVQDTWYSIVYKEDPRSVFSDRIEWVTEVN